MIAQSSHGSGLGRIRFSNQPIESVVRVGDDRRRAAGIFLGLDVADCVVGVAGRADRVRGRSRRAGSGCENGGEREKGK